MIRHRWVLQVVGNTMPILSFYYNLAQQRHPAYKQEASQALNQDLSVPHHAQYCLLSIYPSIYHPQFGPLRISGWSAVLLVSPLASPLAS